MGDTPAVSERDASRFLNYLADMNAKVQNAALRVIINPAVLSNPYFLDAPGGVKKHHQHRYGLVTHVAEVMRNVEKMTTVYGRPSDELITAVIWHDFMKISEYFIEGGEVKRFPYSRKIRHVAGSAMEFHRVAYGKISIATLESVEHLLLSHHGRKEWGSPIEPDSAEAFILHAADMMSATGNNL